MFYKIIRHTDTGTNDSSAFELLEMDQPWFLYYWLSPQGEFTKLENFVYVPKFQTFFAEKYFFLLAVLNYNEAKNDQK